MSTKLSKYSQAQNIASSDILVNDVNAPFTFKDWIVRNTGVIPGKEQLQYESYVKQWYKNKSEEIPTKTTVKADYINLLKQLTLAFKSEADALWLTDINFDDPLEVEQVIPFYATKLKEIAVYLINKREAVRHAKLKYNMTGTYSSLERLFREYLLKAFTKRQFPGNEYITNITDISVLNSVPELSAVKEGFQLFVEELYDDASYFDRDPILPASAYFTFNASATTYLDSLNITPAEYEWLYTTGVSTLCADNPLLWSVDNVLDQYKNGIPLSAVELYDSDVLNDYNRIKLSQKYLGEAQYILSGGYWIPWTKDIPFNFQEGNNWFFWLSGENIFENDTLSIIDPMPLSATNLIDSGATANTSITAADIIYVTRNNSISGAWLRSNSTSTTNHIMSARLNRGKTIFAYPFPGYGLSGEGLEWTGKTFDNLDQTFFYLDKKDQQAVYTAYWNASLSAVEDINPVYINDTLLIEAGAKADQQFNNADYIATRTSFKDTAQDYVFTGEQDYAWLYKMQKTDIPIAIGDNNMYWPFERFTSAVSMFASANQCLPISLSSIDMQGFVGAVAGLNITTADKIFKRTSPNSTLYTEGAWLSGAPLPQPISITTSNILTGCYQPNIAMQILGGAYGSFIWTDPTISANSVFSSVKHQNDCWYLKDQQFSLFKEKPSQNKGYNYNQWQDCTCRAIVYSPFGHPGSTFDDYEGMADFIVSISSPISSFSFKDWKGIDGKSYNSSNEFGWFKLDQQYTIEPDVGWGSGQWVTNTGTPFMLSAGVMYLYYRNDMRRDTPNTTVPYLVAKYKNSNIQNHWMKLYYDKNTNEWKDANIITDMIIKPGDMLTYSHLDTYAFTLTSTHNEYSIQTVPLLPDFNNFDITANLTDTTLPVSSTTIPIQAIGSGSTSSNLILSTIDTISANYYGMPALPFTMTGTFNNLLTTTVTTVLSTITATVTDYFTYTNNAINFILNVPLSGWIYSDNTVGARPFWASASDKDNAYTKQKGIDIWSGSPILVDEYNFITQPPYSNKVITGNSYVEYNKRDIGSIIWKQPTAITNTVNEKQWCKVLLDTTSTSNLSATLYNNINELTVSATNIPSNIILDIQQDEPLVINYYARGGFTWQQSITNSSLGLPPTGGIWIPITSDKLITPISPYVHLSNRHFPTYATVPSVGDLYSTKDSGGYFIPRLLGASIAVSKNRINALNTSRINNDQSKRGVTAVYRELDIYNSDRGLSRNDQIEPVSAIGIDSNWMKESITLGQRTGIITQARAHQEFMPYQSKYESIGSNDNGLYRQGEDAYDPWFGSIDDTWENSTDWPSNWRKQNNIAGWYAQRDKGDKQVYQWKTDIFGNQYAVLKSNFQAASIYDKKHTYSGSLWTRNTRNIVEPANISLSGVFDYTFPISGIDISSMVYETSAVLDIDIWFDTLMIYTSSVLFFAHLNFDYDTGIISSTSDDINYIITDNSKFGGTWFHEEDKLVTICTLISCGDQIRPILRTLNIETNQLNYIYNSDSTYTNMSSFMLSSYEHPVFTYEKDTKTYNISYLGYGTALSGMYLTTMNIRNHGEQYDIITAKTIIPKA